MYDRKRAKELDKAATIPIKEDEDEKSKLIVEAKGLAVPKSTPKTKFVSDYEKNKYYNSKSNIDLPECSTAGSLASRSGGRNLYGYKCYWSPTKTKSPKTQWFEKEAKKSKIGEKDKYNPPTNYSSPDATKGSANH